MLKLDIFECIPADFIIGYSGCAAAIPGLILLGFGEAIRNRGKISVCHSTSEYKYTLLSLISKVKS